MLGRWFIIAVSIPSYEYGEIIGPNIAISAIIKNITSAIIALLFFTNLSQTSLKKLLLSMAINSSFFSSGSIGSKYSDLFNMALTSYFESFILGSTTADIISTRRLHTIIIAPIKIVIPIIIV